MDYHKYKKTLSDLPSLETERLLLRKIARENANDMFAYTSLSQTARYLLWSPHLNIEETKGYIEYLTKEYEKGNCADWGLSLKENGVFIGTCGFADLDLDNNKGELGYVLSPAYQGKGYMKEAASAVLELAFFRLDINRVELRIISENIDSVRFAEGLGFVYEGTARRSMYIKGQYRDIMHYSMLLEDYLSSLKNK